VSGPTGQYLTTCIEADDVAAGFECGEPSLDVFFARHAQINTLAGLGTTYVMRRSASDDPSLPRVLGYYCISMATADPSKIRAALGGEKLPRYPTPVALIGKLASHTKARGRRVGEALLLDALRRILDMVWPAGAPAPMIGCRGVVVDALNANVVVFYERYGFIVVEHERWPRQMFMRIETVQRIRAGAPAPG
jgi:hypothetical protein